MNVKPFTLRFKDIDILAKMLAPKPIDFDGDYYSFDFNGETRVLAEQKVVVTLFSAVIRDKEKTEQLAHFAIACVYEIPQLEETILKDDKGVYQIPDDLDIITKSTTYSTLRGVIFAELRGTYLANAIMPLMPLDNLRQKKVPPQTENID